MNEITLIFKTPDVFDQLYGDADDKEVRKRLRNWIKNDETIAVKFDLDKMEAKVVEVGSLMNYYVAKHNPLQIILHKDGSIIASIEFNSEERGVEEALEILRKLRTEQKDLKLE